MRSKTIATSSSDKIKPELPAPTREFLYLSRAFRRGIFFMCDLVLVHGFCESASMWNALLEQFGPNSRILNLDLPGFGSRNSEPVLPIEQAAVWVLDQADSAGLNRFTFVGHSMGGYVGASLLQQAPNRLAGLCLMNSHGRADTAEKIQNRIKTIGFLEKHGASPFLDIFVRDLVAPSRDKDEALIAELREMVDSTPVESIIGALSAMMDRKDQVELLATSPVPVQLILGQADKMYSPLEVMASHTDIPLLQVNLLDSGHLSPIECPADAAAALEKFLGFSSWYGSYSSV